MDVNKILWLCHPESDYGEAFLYHGLKRFLGESNVLEYPNKLSYHGKVDTSYTLPDGKQGMTCPLPWMPSYPEYPMSEEDVIDRVQNSWFDVVVLSAPRKTGIDVLRTLKSRLGNVIPIPVVICDGEDGDKVRSDLWGEFGAKVMFKREHTTNTQHMYPLPFASPADQYPDLNGIEKDTDIVFLMGLTSPKRTEIYKAVTSLREEFEVYAALMPDSDRSNQDMFLPWPSYIRKTASAKIAVSVRGFGWDTCRYWEIPPTGTLMLCDRIGIQVPNPFQEGVHIACFDTAEDFINKARHFIENDDERECIAAAGKEHAMNYHTCEARGRYFVEKLREIN